MTKQKPSSNKASKGFKLSCYIITKNEEERLAATLKAARHVADEIIVVDSGSTDGTLAIAKKYADKTIHNDWVSYANQKNFAQNKCAHKWVLSLDADEVLTPDLIAEINAIKSAEKPAFYAYNMRIKSVLPHQTKPHTWAKEYNIIRLYHKDYATMHAHLLTEDRIETTKPIPVGQLKAACNHYSYMGLSRNITKLNKYSDDAVHTALKKKRYPTWRLVTEFPYQFIRCYIVRRYFMDGTYGFIIAFNLAYFRWAKIAKVIERNLQQQHKSK